MSPHETFTYLIDSQDRFVEVDENWLRFAQENGARHLARREAVLGRPLWDFIVGQETRHIYELMLAKVRMLQVTLQVPFRCDSPGCRRFMEMQISPEAQGGVRFTTWIVRLEHRAPVGLLEASEDRSSEFITICSWCKKVQIAPGTWAEVEEAVRALDLFASPRLPQLTHGMCPSCKEFYMQQLAELDQQVGKR